MHDRLTRPVDASSLAVFRMFFGLLVTVGAIRFLERGWVEQFFVQPDFFFKFYLAPWVQVGPAWFMYAVIIAIAVLGVLIALGLFYRAAILTFFVLFTYLELTDVTNYLNHYYQMSLLGLLLCFLPLHCKWSLDAKRDPNIAANQQPNWMVYLLRFQVAVVYLFAALAKCNSDWLIHAQPLNIWLMPHAQLPLLGWLFGSFAGALALSWLGFLHDLLIVPALLLRRTRAVAFCVLVSFHLVTGRLFNIGLFPLIMIATATFFFDPDWPKRFLRAFKKAPRGIADAMPTPPRFALGRLGIVAIALWCTVQILVPLRSVAYSGPVNWHEQGMRFAWKVMVREKSGSVTFSVRHKGRTRDRLVAPSSYLSDYQEREMSGQPDLILQLAHHIAADFRKRGYEQVEVRADALVSWNGRPAARLIDSKVDLAATKDGFTRADWVLPAPSDEPIRLNLTQRGRER